MAALMKGNCWHERCDAKKRNGDPVVTYPVYVEDKHDEIRCHVKVLADVQSGLSVTYDSYAGKPLANMGRFDGLFIAIARGTGHCEFDMGFECNGNFNDSYRWVRSTKGVPDDLKDATFKFFVFGLPDHPCAMYKQMQYRLEVAAYAKDWVYWGYWPPVLVPFFQTANSPAEVGGMFLNARARGREGVMVKQVHATYERKRTDGWLKMKPEAEADGVITELLEAHATVDDPERGVRAGDALGRIGSVRVRMPDGSEACPHGIAHDLGVEMKRNPHAFLGEWCEFNYMERDRQGGYRHPTFNRVREAKQ